MQKVFEVIFSSEAFWTAILGLITWGTTFIFSKIKGNEATAQAIDALHSGIALVEEDIVKELKAASADGKLTKEEIEQVRTHAFNKALELAKGPAKDLLLSWGKPKIDALITRIVQSKKAE